MGSEWRELTLGSVLRGQIRHGLYKPLEQFGSGTRVVKMGLQFSHDRIGRQEMPRVPLSDTERRRYLVQEGDLLFSRTSMMADGAGKCSLVEPHDEPFVFDGNILCATPNGQVADPRFIYYYFKSARGRQAISEIIAGTQARSLSSTSLSAVRIVCPSLPEQRRIAGILGALDDKIELNRRMSQTLGSLVRGYVDRALADRPMVPYGSALEVRMGAPFKGAAFSAPRNGRPLLRIRDLKTFVSGTWTTEVRADETTIGPGDIVVGMDAEFRATLWLGEESVLNQRVCSFRGIDGVGRAFVLSALGPDLAFQEQAKTGTTVIHLNKADIDAFTVPELSVSEHRRLTATTEPLIELVVANSIQNHSLIAIRDALIARLLSNRICVPQEVSA